MTQITVNSIIAEKINVNWIRVVVATSEGVFVVETDKVRLGQITKAQWAERAIRPWEDSAIIKLT
jgi:hypothetical protein